MSVETNRLSQPETRRRGGRRFPPIGFGTDAQGAAARTFRRLPQPLMTCDIVFDDVAPTRFTRALEPAAHRLGRHRRKAQQRRHRRLGG